MDNVSLSVDGSSMAAYIVNPAVSSTTGIILLQEAFGVNAHIRDVANRLAALGYLVIAPELFHRTAEHFEASYDDLEASTPHRQALTVEGIEADCRAAYDWLRANGATTVAAIGFCMGGRSAYIANSALPLAAAVSFYGAGIQVLTDRASKLAGPMLLFWGGKDQAIPAEHRQQVAVAFEAAGKPYVDVVFAEAGHGFHCDVRASYHQDSARQAWALTKEFFATYL